MPEPFLEAPEEVVRYFDAKNIVPTWHWRDFAPTEHALSFTVAKSAGYDILEDVKSATQKAINKYGSYKEFVADLEPTLRTKGWWGRKIVDGPNGTEIVQLGSLRRLRTIYWANVTTARTAGEWERIQRTKRGLPFLIYELSTAENRRLEHMQWVGIILPVDHPFWATHYPPNGWLCQCRVRQISRYEAEQLGYDPETPAPQIIMRSWTDKRTGQVMEIPKGIDPGWQTNPGATRAHNVSRFLGDRLEALKPQARRVAVRDLVGTKMFRALQSGDLPYAGANDRTAANIENGRIALPLGKLPTPLAKQMGAISKTILFSNADAHKQAAKRVRRDGRQQLAVEDYALVQEIIETGTAYEDARFERDFVFQKQIDGKPWAVVLRLTKRADEIFLKSFRRIRPDQFGESDILIPME